MKDRTVTIRIAGADTSVLRFEVALTQRLADLGRESALRVAMLTLDTEDEDTSVVVPFIRLAELPFAPATPADPMASIRHTGDGVWRDSRGFTFALVEGVHAGDCTDSECYEPTEVAHPTWFFQSLTDDAVLHVDHFTVAQD